MHCRCRCANQSELMKLFIPCPHAVEPSRWAKRTGTERGATRRGTWKWCRQQRHSSTLTLFCADYTHLLPSILDLVLLSFRLVVVPSLAMLLPLVSRGLSMLLLLPRSLTLLLLSLLRGHRPPLPELPAPLEVPPGAVVDEDGEDDGAEHGQKGQDGPLVPAGPLVRRQDRHRSGAGGGQQQQHQRR